MIKSLFLIFCFLFSFKSFSQRFDVLNGDLKNSKGITVYNVLFIYDSLSVHGYETEEAYLLEKMQKREDKGTDEKFKEHWYDDRTNLYEPSFVTYFNNRFSKEEIKLDRDLKADYTMEIKTTWIYPGYFAEPAKISAIVTIYENQNPKNVLVSLFFDKVIGIEKEQFNGNQGKRVASAYEKLAKNLSIQMKRFL